MSTPENLLSNYLLVSIGTFSPTFDDLTISVHSDGGKPRYIANLTPEVTKNLLILLQNMQGSDSSDVIYIPLKLTQIGLSYEQSKEHYESTFFVEREK